MPGPTAASPTPETKSRLDSLTIVRWVAALWVVAMHVHMRVPLDLPPLLNRFALNGGYAMTLFFVLSGIVLAYGYHRMSPVKEDVLGFYRARFARIYPAYAILHVAALYWAFPAQGQNYTQAAYSNLLAALGLQAWFPHAAMAGASSGTWSISTEFFFYALFPALLPALAFARQCCGGLRLVALLCLVSGAIGFVDVIFLRTFIYYHLPIMRLPEFMVGVVIGLEIVSSAPASRLGGLRLGLAALAALAVAFNPSTEHGSWIRAHALTVPSFAWLLYELARHDQRSAPAPSSMRRLLIYFGESSYCLFLMHLLPVLWLDSDPGRAWVSGMAPEKRTAIWAAFFAVSLAGSITLHELVEKPLRRRLLWHWGTGRSGGQPV